MRCIDEEACDHSVKLLRIGAKDLHELARSHLEIVFLRVTHEQSWASIWHLYFSERITVLL